MLRYVSGANDGENREQPSSPPPLAGTIDVVVPFSCSIKQALHVQLLEPDMEVSAKQEGSKRFDDPGIAAALAGDFDADSPAGSLSSATAVTSGKMEPMVSFLPALSKRTALIISVVVLVYPSCQMA